jgi:Gamma tubulin complex component N-terminal
MHLIGAPAHSQEFKTRGVLHQALAAAVVQHELREFYRLMAMLQSLVLRPVATGAGDSDTGYLTLRRLATWLRDATRRMCTLVELAEQCHGKKARALYYCCPAHASISKLIITASSCG